MYVLAYSSTTSCPSSYDQLSVVIQSVVHRNTTSCPSQYDRLSVILRTHVCFLETYDWDNDIHKLYRF